MVEHPLIGSKKIRPRPYRTNVNPEHRNFSASAAHHLSGVRSSVDDNFKQPIAIGGSWSGKMATTSRLGSAVLSRLSAPTLRPSSRAFSTSIALRAGPNSNGRDAPPPQRMNPLVGNFSRRQPTAEEPAVRTRAPMTPRSLKPQQPVEASSDLPPPPPTPESLLPNLELKTDEQHPYTASKTATPFNLDIASIIANKNASFGQGISADPMARPRVRAKAVTGRTVFVKDRMTPTSGPTPMIAFRVLNKMVREQQVKTKFHSQKFHERKGLKKKRLRSQRWRTRFKSGFKETVNRVLELKRQGW